MSMIADFPGNCITNTHILHDFAEIAYIVCTHAIPATTENVTDAISPGKILDRLRNAEKQFRQHSILVALDTERLELFTFYRKVDVVKDQRTILSKFGYVCRLNSCIISAKSAARVLELLKPESSRIYRLFTSAVLSSIQVLPRGSESATPIGARVYLVPVNGESNAQPGTAVALCSEWQIHRVHLQIIASGQLVLTVQNAKNAILTLLSDLELERGALMPPSGSLLYLAPTGKIARFVNGLVGTRSELSERLKVNGTTNRDEIKVALTQISATADWLKHQYPASWTELVDSTKWNQIEIALLGIGNEVTAAAENSMVWRSLMWPSNLIFVFKKTGDFHGLPKQGASEIDPLRFALEWYNGSIERSGQLAGSQALNQVKDEADDGHVFNDEGHFEDQFNAQMFGPPVFPASQMVYPTPPEAAIAHQTPGMSSVDGLAPTPAPALNISQPDLEPFLDEEMSDIHDQAPDRVGTGFYNEDLFEEMPDDKYEPNVDADEPNWDFFDPPGFGPSNNEEVKAEDPHSGTEIENADLSTTADVQLSKEDVFPLLDSPAQDKQNQLVVQEVDLGKSSPDRIESIYTHDFTSSPITIHERAYVGKPLVHATNHKASTGVELPLNSGDQSLSPPTLRRRSSVFEGVALSTGSRGHDHRYDKHGKFWFDTKPIAKVRETPNLPYGLAKRTTSSGSDTSMTSTASCSNSSTPTNIYELSSNKRTWTEYRPESSAEDSNQVDDVDHEQVESDVKELLSVISAASGEDPFLVQIEPFGSHHKRPNYSAQKTLMIAQILVDQVSQSSLLRNEASMQLHRKAHCAQMDVSIDHGGARTAISHATLADLASIPPRNTAKVVNLSGRLVCVSRANTEIIARQAILPFWDTLGLQPYNQTKDITTFCVFPSSSNVADACRTFLSRLADTYTSCNLGTHGIGRFAGLTNDGLLPWTSTSTSDPTLKHLCERLGSAIGGSTATSDQTIVVYMISPSKGSSCYREICHAFTTLFDSFIDTSEGLTRNVELVLQIIPLDFIASADTMVVPSQDAYLELALEVYNRVPVRQLDAIAASCGSAVILDKYLARDPSFELSNTPVSPFSKEGSCLHLAYSYSPDKRWITAAWSDERGLIAFTMSYCLHTAAGGKGHSKREVFRNIWDISHDIMGRLRAKWRLVVAHTGFYEMEDAGEWQHLVGQSSEDRKFMSRLILLSIELNPDITIQSPGPILKATQQHAISHGPNTSGTPVSTPQANMTSPDQVVAATPTSGGLLHGNVATPPEHTFESGHDIETTLVDPTDQTWAIILSFGVNQSWNFLDIRPAAASGLLVKRTGSRDDTKALRLLGVNLVAAPRLQPTSLSLSERETILQDMMEQMRGLVTLALSRGCIDRSSDCVPWHVAAAVKGSRVLGDAM